MLAARSDSKAAVKAKEEEQDDFHCDSIMIVIMISGDSETAEPVTA